LFAVNSLCGKWLIFKLCCGVLFEFKWLIVSGGKCVANRLRSTSSAVNCFAINLICDELSFFWFLLRWISHLKNFPFSELYSVNFWWTEEWIHLKKKKKKIIIFCGNSAFKPRIYRKKNFPKTNFAWTIYIYRHLCFSTTLFVPCWNRSSLYYIT
jgi:hypothetical protein